MYNATLLFKDVYHTHNISKSIFTSAFLYGGCHYFKIFHLTLCLFSYYCNFFYRYVFFFLFLLFLVLCCCCCRFWHMPSDKHGLFQSFLQWTFFFCSATNTQIIETTFKLDRSYLGNTAVCTFKQLTFFVFLSFFSGIFSVYFIVSTNLN